MALVVAQAQQQHDQQWQQQQQQQQQPQLQHKLNVALHAQVDPGSGFIVGSVLTTEGMKQALLDSGKVFYPFAYTGLHDRVWDIAIIEGYTLMINAFIHEVRRASHGRTKVFFYCLDPALPGLTATAALDVDGFLTNSLPVLQVLQRSAPTAYLPLAVDAAAFAFQPLPPPLPPAARVVFVGAGGALGIKKDLEWMLLEAAPFGLDIYGSGWGAHAALAHSK
ncbi:hypothetical protein JKP88DRAFT_280775 [Tribonema minus]|uniref:Uncharacterized protein n=1 Tax=Tribonema minus TaxID=303371 RepID=A0A836CBD8_9STRA|nr:hypothetical protein JKP88DRAFT_280775 [Tribonema minus]